MPTENFYDIESLPNAWTLTRYQCFDTPKADLTGHVDIYLLLRQGSQTPVEINNLLPVIAAQVQNSAPLSTTSDAHGELIPQLVKQYQHEFSGFDSQVQLESNLVTWLNQTGAEPSSVADQIKAVNQTFINEFGPFSLTFHSIEPLLDELLAIYDLIGPDGLNSNFERWFGFNSKPYDLPFLCSMLDTQMSAKIEARDQLDPDGIQSALNFSAIFPLGAYHLRKSSDTLILHDKGLQELIYSGSSIDYGGTNDDYHLISPSSLYNRFLKSGNFLDTRVLNEKMKYTSLKRISGQAGYQILESDKLSGDTELESLQDLTDLLAYNLSDTVNTFRLRHESAYAEPFETHGQLLSRFPEHYGKKQPAIPIDNWKRKVAPDTTSAKFIEYLISPDDTASAKMSSHDAAEINFYYPTHSSLMRDLKVGYEKRGAQLYTHLDQTYRQNLAAENSLQGTHHEYDERLYSDSIDAAIQTDFRQWLTIEYPQLHVLNYRWDYHNSVVEEDLLEAVHDRYGIDDQVYEFYRHYQQNEFSLDVLIKKYPKMTTFIRNSDSYILFSVGGAHGEYADQTAFRKLQADAQRVVDKQLSIQDWFKTYVSDHTDQVLNEDLGLTPLNESVDFQTVPLDTDIECLAATVARRAKRTGLPTDYPDELDQEPWLLTTGTYSKARFKKLPKVLDDHDDKDIKQFAKTVFIPNAIHADVDSLYPTLLSNLHVFKNPETLKIDTATMPQGTDDLYAGLRAERLKLKHALPHDPSTWTDADKHNNDVQLLDKLLLNSATGAADATFENNIRMPHRIVKMRLCGQLAIGALAYALTDAGAEVVSTNTDGVYFTDIDLATSSAVIQKWAAWLHLSADPEVIPYFISKDTNNRLELLTQTQANSAAFNTIKSARGATIGAYKGLKLDKNASKPTITDNILTNYLKRFSSHQNNPLDRFDDQWVLEQLKVCANYLGSRKNALSTDQWIRLTSHFQWIFANNRAKNRYFMPVNADVEFDAINFKSQVEVHDGRSANHPYTGVVSTQMVNRAFLITPKAFESPDEAAAGEQLVATKHGHPLTLDQLSAVKAQQAAFLAELKGHTATMRLLTINKSNKELSGDTEANLNELKLVGHLLKSAKLENIVNADNKLTPRLTKINGITDDNFVYIANQSLTALNSRLFHYLDLDRYADLIHQQWDTWAKEHVIFEPNQITQPVTN